MFVHGVQYGACVSIRCSPVCVPSGSTCPSESYLSHNFTDLEHSCFKILSWCGWFLCTLYKDALLATYLINCVLSLKFSFELYHAAGGWSPASHRVVPPPHFFCCVFVGRSGPSTGYLSSISDFQPIRVGARSKTWDCASRLPGLRVRIPLGAWSECDVLSGGGLCTRPEESYRVCGVWMWSWSLDNGEALTP